jgi:anti-sigma factor (TIGR02949 family)
MINCHDAVGLLWEYLDHSTDDADRAKVEAHLARCRRCCAEMEFAQELRRVLVDVSQVEVPTDVMSRLKATLSELDR